MWAAKRTEFMKSYQSVRKIESALQKTALLVLLATAAGLPAIQRTEAAANVVVWDTLAHLPDVGGVADRAGWKPVPTDLLTLEADPPKAASDPGYYGREYSFTGDAVVENRSLAAVFWSGKGRVVIYSKTSATPPGGASSGNTGLGRKILEFTALQTKTQPASISHCELLRNADDEVALEVFFSAKGSADVSAVFAFGKTEIVEIKPAANMKGISLLGLIEYGVVPSFVGDDLIFDPAQYPSANALCIPSENLFLGLLPGEEEMLVMTWPKGKQQLKLSLGKEQQGKRLIESIDFDNDGQSLYLAALGAPGIWHREELKPTYLEKDTAINWKRPFPAKWKTQLTEAGVKTTFTFRESKGQIWRGVPGSYNYPVWFNGDDAFYHLSKKVPPQGESLIYFLDGQDTPVSVSTPVDILKATLGRPMSDSILDIAGRKLRTHHRRGGAGVHRACTCGCTEVIQAVFESGEEVAKKEYIKGALDDMIYFVQHHVERIEEYRRFADDTVKFLEAKGSSSPELKAYVDSLEQIAQQIPQEYDVQKENMKSLDYADELAHQTIDLTSRKDANNLKAYMELLKTWRAMGGAQDYVVAQCHAITRKLCQEAGYGCVAQPKAAELAEEIRRRCRQCLRNPDGYEIWADY
ncbi:MAG: hypothetical protein DME23_06580 [Verrucomicrobia bacterium]|nr:MAG: hypothetical protein DME23_06580 [Verrucomicrobiota bacterium]